MAQRRIVLLALGVLASSCTVPSLDDGEEQSAAMPLPDIKVEIEGVREHPGGVLPGESTWLEGGPGGTLVRSTAVMLPPVPRDGRYRVRATTPLQGRIGETLQMKLLRVGTGDGLSLVDCVSPPVSFVWPEQRQEMTPPEALEVVLEVNGQRQCFPQGDRCVPFAECGLAGNEPLAVVVAGNQPGTTPYALELSSPDFDGATDTRPVAQGGCSMREIRRAQQLCRSACTRGIGCVRSRGIHECAPARESSFEAWCAYDCEPGVLCDRTVAAPSPGTRLVCNDGAYSPTCDCAGPSNGCCSWHNGVAGCND